MGKAKNGKHVRFSKDGKSEVLVASVDFMVMKNKQEEGEEVVMPTMVMVENISGIRFAAFVPRKG